MALYFLSYDLRKKRDYQKLYDELNRFKAVKILESLYCFNRYNTNAKDLRDYCEGVYEMIVQKFWRTSLK